MVGRQRHRHAVGEHERHHGDDQRRRGGAMGRQIWQRVQRRAHRRQPDALAVPQFGVGEVSRHSRDLTAERAAGQRSGRARGSGYDGKRHRVHGFLNRRYGGAGDRGWAAYLATTSRDYAPGIYWGAIEAYWGAAVQTQAIVNWRAYGTDDTWVNVNGGTPVVDTVSTEAGRTEWIRMGQSSVHQPAFRAGEIVIGNSLSTNDRQRVEGYLAHKWGLTALLPAGHPYKSAAP